MPGSIWSQKETTALIDQVLDPGRRSGAVIIAGRTYRGIYHQIQVLREKGVLPKAADRRYRPEEERLLVTQVSQGKPLKEIQVAGRSLESIYSHIKLLRRKGFKQLTLKRLWMPSEDSLVISQVNGLGRTPKQVVVEGRSPKSIYNRIKVLRKDGKITRYFRKRSPQRPWDRREIEEVLLAAGQNGRHRGAVSLKKAGLFPDRSVAALSRMISRCGLADPKKSQAVKTRLKVTSEQKKELHRWLKREGRHMPTALVAQRFGFREDFVTRFRQRYGLQVNHQKALSEPVYHAWHQAQVMKRVQARMAVHRKNREDRLRRMVHLDRVLKTLCTKTLRKKCRTCGRKWFATRDFFRVRTRRQNGREHYFFDYLCWACPATNGAGSPATPPNTRSTGSFSLPSQPYSEGKGVEFP